MTVSQTTVQELRELIADVVEEKFAKYGDPDYGLELREDFRAMLIKQSKHFEEGKLESFSFDEVLADLGIDRAEIEVDENVSAAVS